jgi:two-component SAPR family response regulator
MNLDLISDIESNSLVLVGDNHTLMSFALSEVRQSTQGKWINAELSVDTDNNLLKFILNGYQKTADYNVRRQKKFNIYFGRNNDLHFATTDVAPFILKNVRLSNKKKRLIRHWKLNKHGNDGVFDECKSAKAVVTNAVWEINRRAEWEKRATITVTGKYPQIAFDRERKRIFIVKHDRIYVYDAEKDVTGTFHSKKGVPYNVEINQLFYDPTNGELISYDFGKNSLARFDFAAQTWNNEDHASIGRHFMHHNKYFDDKKQILYTLGGYGFHQYSALLQSFSDTDTVHPWKSADVSDVIHPRYLAAMGAWNDSLLLFFGGYGNASGKQYESPHNYYDLYAVNPSTLNVRKIWELSNVDKHFTNSNSLVVNPTNQTFYTLSYPNNIFDTQVFLHEYCLQSPEFRRLGNPLPFRFNDNESFCDLFIPSDSSALFAVTSYMEGNNSQIGIYSISYPPLGSVDTLQAENPWAWPLHLLLYGMACVVTLGGIYWIIRRLRRAIRIHSVLKTIESNNESDKKADEEAGKTLFPAIHMLGTFEVWDPKGINISHLFTPTISQVFFLLYFKTMADNGKGITSNELQKTLWPDKDYDSARNSRNVYFTKLRPLLNRMGNVALSKTNDYWTLEYGNEIIYNDYEKVMKNIAFLRKEAVPDKELLNETLRMARRGKLLPYCEVEWADNYKTAYVNTLIEYFSELVERPEVKNDWTLLLNIAEVILIQDSIEELGVKLKCNILFKFGKKKQALQCYNKYVEEYLNILNIRPELTFNDIMR